MAESHRNHTQDSGKGCHKYRTQTAAGGSYGSRDGRHSALAAKTRIVNEHDTVLNYDTNQHYGTQHTHQVDGCTGKCKCNQHTAECERY